ncbi:MAG: UvrD-helicase domain-containing protein, partial [Campylobacterota bacterium]
MSFHPFVAYEASAGSGKTFQLTIRYLALLFLDQSPESILTVTFTKKAAAQMRERIINTLTNLDDFTRQLIAQESGLSEDTIKNSQEMVKKRFLHSSA